MSMACLISKGLNGDRINTAGEGERLPIADNATAEVRVKNRRVDI
jgi:OOP family OmpA-OmpF porin